MSDGTTKNVDQKHNNNKKSFLKGYLTFMILTLGCLFLIPLLCLRVHSRGQQ